MYVAHQIQVVECLASQLVYYLMMKQDVYPRSFDLGDHSDLLHHQDPANYLASVGHSEVLFYQHHLEFHWSAQGQHADPVKGHSKHFVFSVKLEFLGSNVALPFVQQLVHEVVADHCILLTWSSPDWWADFHSMVLFDTAGGLWCQLWGQ